MIVTDWIFLLFTFTAGASVAWLITSALAKASIASALSNESKQRAAAESRIEELRQQLTSIQAECNQTREQFHGK